ncbi:hypothetical protein GLOIN_2v618243 [Rhizophagus clarus]|uniref:Uncharacterized protein n=1 Tax=Rhizophagus clarus TaxID=94130 RepID=A0A8H3M807_9GLOM|nr:hypothetical protein GLOIN_2v618243 [Rhizophagus clarus]
MRLYNFTKVLVILYSIVCIVIEIWYIGTLSDIENYNDYGVDPEIGFMKYTDSVYFSGKFVLIMLTLYHIINDCSMSRYICAFILIQILIIHLGTRYIFPDLNLGEIPLNCNFNHYLPENVKTACKARYISYILNCTSFAAPLGFLLETIGFYTGFYDRIINYLQRNLIVL